MKIIEVRACQHGHRLTLVQSKFGTRWWENETGKRAGSFGFQVNGRYTMLCIPCLINRAAAAGEILDENNPMVKNNFISYDVSPKKT